MRWMIQNLGIRTLQLQYMATAVLCGEDQFPELSALLTTARSRIDFQGEPTLYLTEHPHLNAMTAGAESSFVIVHSALLDQMSDQEVTAILGQSWDISMQVT